MEFGRGRVDPVRWSLNAPPGVFVYPLRVKIMLVLRLTDIGEPRWRRRWWRRRSKSQLILLPPQPSSHFCQICQGKAARLAPCQHTNIWLWCGEPEAHQACARAALHADHPRQLPWRRRNGISRTEPGTAYLDPLGADLAYRRSASIPANAC